MKRYKNESETLFIEAHEADGKYYLTIDKWFKRIVATKGSRKPHTEDDFSRTRKEFTNKESANRYFLAIKRNNPTLKEF